MTPSLSERVIVVIEDSDEDYEVTVWALRSAGVKNRVFRCATPVAIDELLMDQAGRPSALAGSYPLLVLLDINLPGTNRHETQQRLRSHPWWRVVPVVIISTSGHPNDVSASYGLGAAGYLLKPLDLEAFAASVRRLAAYWLDAVVLPDPNYHSAAKISSARN